MCGQKPPSLFAEGGFFIVKCFEHKLKSSLPPFILGMNFNPYHYHCQLHYITEQYFVYFYSQISYERYCKNS